MARVRAKELFFDNIVLREPGEEFDFDGAPGKAIEFLDPKDKEVAERKLAAAIAARTRADVVAAVKAEEIERIRAQVIAEYRVKIEAEVRAQIKAERAAGKDDGELV
jgi:hypothetical protein